MRLPATVSIGILFLLAACGQEDGINPAEEVLDFFPNAKLTTKYPFAFPGENVVFHRHVRQADQQAVADDEYSEDFFFEVENPGDSFEYSGEELSEIKPLFLYYCYCSYSNDSALVGGTVRGTRISDKKYEVQVDVTYEYYYIEPTSKDTIDTITRRVKFEGTHHVDGVPSAAQG